MIFQLNKIYYLKENRLGLSSDNRLVISFVNGFLNFEFEIKNDSIFNPYLNDNDPIYEYDAVEVFISFDKRIDKYYELELSPSGVRFFALIDNPTLDKPFATLIKPNFLYDVKELPGGFYGKISIDTNLIDGFDFDNILFNCFAIDTNKEKEQSLYALNPTLSNTFHLSNFFVKLENF